MGESALCKLDFFVTVSVANVAARLYIINRDRAKNVKWGESFTITFNYNLGNPKVTNSPFGVSVSSLTMGAPLPTIVGVSPPAPQTSATNDPYEELRGVVQCMAPPQPENMSPSEAGYPCWDFNVTMYQPEFDTESGLNTLTGPDDPVPNIRASIDNNAYIAWDNPLDDEGNPIDVEAQITITGPDGEELAKESFYVEEGNIIGIDYDTLMDIYDVEIDVGDQVDVTVELRPEDSTDPEDVFSHTFYFPLRNLFPAIALFEATAGDEEVELRFRPTTTSAALQGWEYRYRPTGAVSWLAYPWQTHLSNNTEQEITITGLTNSVSYDFELRALASTGYYSSIATASATPVA